ncbi:major facilitator superfamily domain-containing protein [Chaetomium strumarium]|uniref:Major facilitator superfamily domain-containing protein n=1 Tax=Chaetomium strumarium TaxID=1170767 RepID=A0AAJ0GPX5_9PEZI|nr:major facilitator superfamily domain-containing protein [Chaetomium strumarium]
MPDGNTVSPSSPEQAKTPQFEARPAAAAGEADPEKAGSSSISSEAQAGVKNIEAAASVWSKWHLVAAYGIIWLIYFVTSLQEVLVRTFTPFVTSSFQLHSLTAATSIFSSIIAGLSKLPLAKILDLWGRPQGMALMLVFWVIGFCMMAACKNVETYAAAQVFSSVGAQGVSYCLTVFIADTSSLKNRGLMLSFATSPYIATTFAGGPLADAFLSGPGWRWGFGVFAILNFAVTLPLVVLFFWDQHRAKKLGVVNPTKREDHHHHPLSAASLKKFAIDFDLLGVFLLAAGMAMFLTPLSIWSYQAKQWRSPLIICLIVFGAVLIIIFALYERFLAPVNFVPPRLLADRNVLLAGATITLVFFNSAVWGSYFSSMLMVVWNQSVTHATYINNIYRVGSCLSALLFGFAIRYTRRFKWVALYFAVPLMLLGVGLMIQFRQPDAAIGYVVMTQVFVAFAGGPIVICVELAMMSTVDHQHIAAILAILDLFSSVGYAVGSTVSAAIWTGSFPAALRRHLPAGAPVEAIYSSLYTQLGYVWGSPIRQGIALAYADAQRYMLITSVCLLAGALIATAFWRDVKLKDKQVKGLVA